MTRWNIPFTDTDVLVIFLQVPEVIPPPATIVRLEAAQVAFDATEEAAEQ